MLHVGNDCEEEYCHGCQCQVQPDEQTSVEVAFHDVTSKRLGVDVVCFVDLKDLSLQGVESCQVLVILSHKF